MISGDPIRRNGFTVIRGAVPPDWLADLRRAFESGFAPSEQWPVPRGHDWRHAMVDLDPVVRETCRLPDLVAAAGALLGQPFFLAQVEGREPCRGNSAQPLHRDGDLDATTYAAAIVFLDDFGASNGATRLVPGPHRKDWSGDPDAAITLDGAAGDVLIFDPNLLHGGGSNASGAPRRSLLVSWACAEMREALAATAALRGIRMDFDETFSEDGRVLAA